MLIMTPGLTGHAVQALISLQELQPAPATAADTLVRYEKPSHAVLAAHIKGLKDWEQSCTLAQR